MYNDISISDSIAERLKNLRENWEDEKRKIKKAVTPGACGQNQH